jgi:hypothetical protein
MRAYCQVLHDEFAMSISFESNKFDGRFMVCLPEFFSSSLHFLSFRLS